jgi:hypothetical protein
VKVEAENTVEEEEVTVSWAVPIVAVKVREAWSIAELDWVRDCTVRV